MRIISINNIIPMKNTKKQSVEKISRNQEQTEPQDFRLNGFPAAYFVSFKGYKEDEEFLETAQIMLDNTVGRVNDIVQNKFDDAYNSPFLTALDSIKEDKQLYAKVTESPDSFNKIESSFESFDENFLKSLNDVRNTNKQFTKYWEENSFIGEKRIADIISESANSPKDNVNKIIKKANEKTFGNIKNTLIKSWFEDAYGNIKNEKPETITNNIENLSEVVNKEYAQTFIRNEKLRLCEGFNKKTKEKILSSESTQEERIHALKVMLSFVESKLLEDKGKKLENDYEIILGAARTIVNAKDKESVGHAKNAIKALHILAFEQWEKDNLNQILNVKLQKEIFTKTEEKKNTKLYYFQNYPNFDTDSKYFVSRYYNARYLLNNMYDYDDKDYLLQIINDRHNTKLAQNVVNEIGLAVQENQNIYFSQLDSFYDVLQARKYNPEIKMPERIVETPNDKISFADLYLDKLGKVDDFKKCTESEKLDFLTKLTKNEINLLNIELKIDWHKNTAKYALLEEVSKQAKNTSVFLGMYEELKKINVNLDEIKIKTNDIAVSLKDVIENKSVLSSKMDDESCLKLCSQLAGMQRVYDRMSPEQKMKVDEKMSEVVPKLIDSISAGQKDAEVNKMLKELSKMSKAKQPTDKTLGFLKHILISRGVAEGIGSGKDYYAHAKNAAHAIKTMALPSSTLHDQLSNPIFSDFTNMLPDLSPLDAIGHAATGLAATTAAGHSSWLAGVGSSAMAHPAVLAGAAVVVAVGGAFIAANKAGKLEKNQRDLTFIVEI